MTGPCLAGSPFSAAELSVLPGQPAGLMERRLAEFRAAQRKVAPPAMGTARAWERSPEPAREDSEPLLPSPQEIAVLPRGSPEDVSSLCQLKSGRSLLSKTLLIKFLLWLVLLGLFVELEFGLVYFVLSMFYWIYEGTRGPGEKKEGETSAYSVFNPGCESIQGTLTAEQLERQLQYNTLAGW